MLFYKNYIVYYNVYCYNCGALIEKHVYTKFCLDWILCTWPYTVCPYQNVWPEAIYCCFRRTTYVFMIRVRSWYHITNFVTPQLLVSEIANVYCLRVFIVVLQELHCLLQCLLL